MLQLQSAPRLHLSQMVLNRSTTKGGERTLANDIMPVPRDVQRESLKTPTQESPDLTSNRGASLYGERRLAGGHRRG